MTWFREKFLLCNRRAFLCLNLTPIPGIAPPRRLFRQRFPRSVLPAWNVNATDTLRVYRCAPANTGPAKVVFTPKELIGASLGVLSPPTGEARGGRPQRPLLTFPPDPGTGGDLPKTTGPASGRAKWRTRASSQGLLRGTQTAPGTAGRLQPGWVGPELRSRAGGPPLPTLGGGGR